MKFIKFYTTVLSVSLLFMYSDLSAQKGKKKADKETNEWKYEVEANGTGTQGSYQIKVWTYSKNTDTAIEQAKKNAVHAIIFKGFPSKGRITGQKPLVRDSNIEIEKADFFKDFFRDGGKFQKFVTISNNGAIGSGDRIKIRKKSTKLG